MKFFKLDLRRLTTAELETALKNFQNSLKIENSAERPDKWLIECWRYRIVEFGNEIKARKYTGSTCQNEPKSALCRTYSNPNTASEKVLNTVVNNLEDFSKVNNLHSEGSIKNESNFVMHGSDYNSRISNDKESKVTNNMHYLDVRVPWLQVDLAFSNPRVFVAEFTFFIAEYAFFMQGTTIITT